MPLDLNTLKALKRCSLGLDLYLWLAYRTFALNRPVRITWRQLYVRERSGIMACRGAAGECCQRGKTPTGYRIKQMPDRPPLAVDRLIGLAGVPTNLVKTHLMYCVERTPVFIKPA